MSITENKYHSTVKVEFRELINNIVNSDRSIFHVYTIHRLLSLGLLIDFRFEYLSSESPGEVIMELDLKNYGKAQFIIDTESNYGSVADDQSMTILSNFLQDYKTELDDNQAKNKWKRR